MSEDTLVEEAVDLEEPVVRPKDKKRTRPEDRQKRKKQPPYAVVVHNDERHTWAYVIEVLQRICSHPLERAYELTAQIHFNGQAHVWSGPLEIAELKRDQIRGFGPDDHAPVPVKFPLGVTIEPLPGE